MEHKEVNTPPINSSRIYANGEPLFKHLSYEIVGALFEVYNSLKYGHREKTYQKALEEEFIHRKISFNREVYYPVMFKEKVIGRYYFDFLVGNKVVVELKVAEDFYQKDINLLLSYLKYKNYSLGILAIFTKNDLKYKRIANSR